MAAEVAAAAGSLDPTADDPSLPYSADEAAWLFGLERVAPVPVALLPQPSPDLADRADLADTTPASSSSSRVTAEGAEPERPLVAEPPVGALVSPASSALAEEETAPDYSPTPSLIPALTPSMGPSLSEQVTGARLPSLGELSSAGVDARAPTEVAAEPAAPPVDDSALPLTARQTLHLTSIPTPLPMPTPLLSDAEPLAQQVTPPRGLALYPQAAPVAPAASLGELTANLQLPQAPPPQATYEPPQTLGETSLLHQVAGSLVTNLGMGLLGGLLALIGAAGLLYLRDSGKKPPAVAAPADAMTPARARLLQQAVQALAAGRRQQALGLLREYAAGSPEPAIEEMIRLLEREGR